MPKKGCGGGGAPTPPPQPFFGFFFSLRKPYSHIWGYFHPVSYAL
jgi:hypothetical protein